VGRLGFSSKGYVPVIALRLLIFMCPTDSWYASIKDPVVNWIGLKFSTELSILPTTICLRKFVTSQVRHQHQLSDWLRRYNKSTTNRIQTPLLRFVVDLLWTRNCCTTNPQHVEMLWICCRRLICRGFVVQHFDLSWICRRFVMDLLYNLLYNKSTTIRISGVWA